MPRHLQERPPVAYEQDIGPEIHLPQKNRLEARPDERVAPDHLRASRFQGRIAIQNPHPEPSMPKRSCPRAVKWAAKRKNIAKNA
jgi:hypothetical protein